MPTIKPLSKDEQYAVVAAAKRVSKLPIKGVAKSDNGGAYTDGETIFLPLDDPKFSVIDQEAIASHEGSHIRFRTVMAGEEVSKSVCAENPNLGHTVMNIVEDRRIETLLAQTYHGYWVELDEFNNRLTGEIVEKLKTEVKQIDQKPESIPTILALMSAIASRSEENLAVLTQDGKFIYASPALGRLMGKYTDALEEMDSQLSFPSTVIASKMICDALRDYMNDDNKPDQPEDQPDAHQPSKGKGKSEKKDLKDVETGEDPSDSERSTVKPTKKEAKTIEKITEKLDKGESVEKIKAELDTDLEKAKESVNEIVEECKELPNCDTKVEQREDAHIIPTEHGEMPVLQWKTVAELQRLSRRNNGADTYTEVVQKYLAMIQDIRRKYDELATDETLERGYRSGRLSMRDVPRMVASDGRFSRCFERIEEDKGADVLVLIDESGSMGGNKIVAAREAAIALVEAVKGTQVRIGILGFAANGGSWEIGEKVYKDLTEPADPAKIGLIGCNWGGVNRDGTSFRAAVEHFKNTSTNEKYLIIVSDGQPNHHSGRDDYSGHEALEDCRKAVNFFEQQCIHTFCLSMDFGSGSYLKDIYRKNNFFVLNTEEQLPTTLIGLVSALVQPE